MAKRRNKRPKASEVVFEMEATQEGSSIFDYLSMWYGPPKIGKSTLLSKFEGVYWLCTEPGYKFLKIRKSKINSWEDFMAFVRKAEKSKKFVSTVKMWCIDPVDKLSKFCMSYSCDRLKIEHPNDAKWGKGWDAFRDDFTEWILRLCALGPGVAVISHVKERDIVIDGVETEMITPAMPKTCYTILNDLCDITIKLGYEPRKRGKKNRHKKQRRCLFTEGTESMEAGNRTGHALPPIIVYDDEEDAIAQIMAAFDEGKEGNLEVKKKKSKKRKKS